MFLLKSSLRSISTTFKCRQNLYRIMKYKDFSEPGIAVYESRDMKRLKDFDAKGKRIQDELHRHAQEKYGQLIPFFIERAAFFHTKHFVSAMSLLPKSEALKLECMGPNGFYEKVVELKNIIPVIYEDYRAGTRRNLFLSPTFLDNSMIYFNTFLEEYYVFDKDALWHEEGLDHPLLDLSVRFNERQWLDYLKLA